MSNFYLNFAKTRACAMVSSPNAGKSTIPERLLLWGATQPAVVALERREVTQYAILDWMNIEKERGILITTSLKMS